MYDNVKLWSREATTSASGMVQLVDYKYEGLTCLGGMDIDDGMA